ncbi:MAG: PPPDE putative peptidase domain-containing protein [Monoraphidium minutum]|nr:MAG: PPPDE putative peptidase domain-containing protein [Monoraphidium minutum]
MDRHRSGSLAPCAAPPLALDGAHDGTQEGAPPGATIEVLLNVYDVVPPDQGAPGAPAAPITRLNNLTRNLFGGVGGIFHGAVVIGDIEYSFGYCESGSGVYHIKAKQNPMYTFRETLSLGSTTLDHAQIMAIIRRMRAEWLGPSYDLLSRNCCHFCDVLASELCVTPVPAWLNRFAVTGAAALQATNDASNAMRGMRDELTRLSGESYSWVRSNLQRTVQAVQEGVQTARAGGLRESVRAAARGWQTALNGRPGAPGSGADDGGDGAGGDGAGGDGAGVAAGAPAEGEPAGGGGGGGGGGMAGVGGSSGSIASSASSHRTALPTTALRWSGSMGAADGARAGSFVGSGEALGKPMPEAGAGAAGGGAP